jgi:hypothetical protein
MQGDSDTLGIFDAMLAAADETTEEEEQQELQRRRETWLASEAGRMWATRGDSTWGDFTGFGSVDRVERGIHTWVHVLIL